MATLTPGEKLKEVKREIHALGLKVRQDKRLDSTPYRAMNPLAAKEKGQPYYPNTLTYSPAYYKKCKRPTHTLAMDLNHELKEMDRMSKGKKYRLAHKSANRKQRNFDWMIGNKVGKC